MILLKTVLLLKQLEIISVDFSKKFIWKIGTGVRCDGVRLRTGLFQDCEASLNHKTELVGRLEAKAQTMTDTIQSLEAK